MTASDLRIACDLALGVSLSLKFGVEGRGLGGMMSRISGNAIGGKIGWAAVLAAVVASSFFTEQLGIAPEDWGFLVVLGSVCFSVVYIERRLARIEQRIGMESLQGERQKRRATMRGPITPEHARREPPPRDDPKVSAETRLFFEHFSRFADVLNAAFHAQGGWRLQESAEQALPSQPYSRRYDIFSGPNPCGRVLISEIHGHRYTTDNPRVFTEIQVWNARSFDADTLVHFLQWLASYVAGESREELDHNSQQIRNAMVMAMWKVDPYHLLAPKTLTVRLQGPATQYLAVIGITSP